MEQSYSDKIKSQLTNLRVDVKNIGNENNDIKITSDDVTVIRPEWFANSLGIGCIISSNKLKNVIKLKIIQSGKLKLDFKGSDKRINGERIPLWIDYKSVKIDGVEILPIPVATWHDKPYFYEMPVKDGQEIIIEIEQQYHQYSKSELTDTILKLNPDVEYIKNNIHQIVSEISKDFAMESDLIPMDDFPKITADCFIPLGFKCQTAYQLRRHNLRFCSLPFDWVFDIPLYMFISSIQKGISDWLNCYSEISRGTNQHKAVKDLYNRMIFFHDFPLDQSVEEYIPEFKEKYSNRIQHMVKLINTSDKICIVCSNRTDSNVDFFRLLKKLHELYPNKTFYLLYVKHSEHDKHIWKYSVCDNAVMYCVNAWNISDKQPDPNDWGNDTLWDNVCKNLSLSEHVQSEKNINDFLHTINTYCIDIKNYGNKNNGVKIKSASVYSESPDFFTDDTGIGKRILNDEKHTVIKLNIINDGKLVIDFKGPYKRVNDERIPLWIDYKSIKIDGAEILSEPIATWHDKPYRYEMPVKNGQEIILELEQQQHKYSKQELTDIIKKINPWLNDNQMSTVVDFVYQKICNSVD